MSAAGLLYSQIGYDLYDPKRALVRSGDRNQLSEHKRFRLKLAESNYLALEGPVRYWGELWGSHWWEIDFTSINTPGEYILDVGGGRTEGSRGTREMQETQEIREIQGTREIRENGEIREIPGIQDIQATQGTRETHPVLWSSEPFSIGDHVLWDASVVTVGIEQMEARALLARNGIGWKDCGSEFRESNSHAATIIGLCDLLSNGYTWMSGDETRRLKQQLVQGCDYLAICQDKAEQLGLGEGAVVHELPNHMMVIPGSVIQCSIAFSYTSRLLSDTDPERSGLYLERARRAYRYIREEAKPFTGGGFSSWNHGAEEGFIPPDEWMTRDLLLMMWAGVELWMNGGSPAYQEDVAGWARQVMERQITPDCAEGGLYGHFRTFTSASFTEKTFIHHHVGHDTGGVFPLYITPFLDISVKWYYHTDAALWKETIRRFAYGYFLPACKQNPFHILPMGYFHGEGLLNFAGPWHGFNVSLAFAATLAVRLEMNLGDVRFREIAVGNVQWIAGLNAGLTSESFGSCVRWKDDIEPGLAVPYSQIYGVGRRYTGVWADIKGSIPNGFSVNPQFRLEVKPSQATDGPHQFTDEDWIPHGAGWVSAVTYLRYVKFFHSYAPV
ncbi:hypothetical protein SY83_04920 [Paenibacillus swuensis]|uniref:Cellulase Ig-like domain-containing protein n=1 Tax=Paenibacillus swuensis TaxID=1178515 RepID=A0A172TFB9_9BACL|nr:cellulase N-terminal Ig-like domain-containing protein [Paenibacillus swuensis]ANE45748.1 hypothetical protein SY83_04920 [Paenibacillus swuensis]